MKTAEARDQMVARVQKAFQDYPTFEEVPEVSGGDYHIPAGIGQHGYVEALYKICYEHDLIGRNGPNLIGKKVA